MSAKEKITRAAMRHGFSVRWQPLRFGLERAVFDCGSYAEMDAVRQAIRRLHGVSITGQWVNADGGVFEGYVYAMDCGDAQALNTALRTEKEKVENWNLRYHYADAETRRLMACGKMQ